LTGSTRADLAQHDAPAINYWQLLRSLSYISCGRLDIGDHRFDQVHFRIEEIN